jgi:hypothetical protein
MHCEDAARRLYEGERTPDLEIHLSACDECRLLSEDLSGLGEAFARARTEWAPSSDFKVTIPAAPWRKLAIAACLLVLPLAGWAASSLQTPRTNYDMTSVFDPATPATPSDPQILATLFLEDSSR